MRYLNPVEVVARCQRPGEHALRDGLALVLRHLAAEARAEQLLSAARAYQARNADPVMGATFGAAADVLEMLATRAAR